MFDDLLGEVKEKEKEVKKRYLHEYEIYKEIGMPKDKNPENDTNCGI
jgi:hypothetical protein